MPATTPLFLSLFLISTAAFSGTKPVLTPLTPKMVPA
jgi:hypothetical protein